MSCVNGLGVADNIKSGAADDGGGTARVPLNDNSANVVAKRTSSNENCAVCPPISTQLKWIPVMGATCWPETVSAEAFVGIDGPGVGSSQVVTLVDRAEVKSNRITSQRVALPNGTVDR